MDESIYVFLVSCLLSFSLSLSFSKTSLRPSMNLETAARSSQLSGSLDKTGDANVSWLMASWVDGQLKTTSNHQTFLSHRTYGVYVKRICLHEW